MVKQQKHYVLVPGGCLGAWSWYKLKPLLESAGHKVTALDLSAAGINTRKIQDLVSFYDYTLPLLQFMASIPAGEKVILVGHSFGGLSLAIAIAMENYPDSILVAVFVDAFMPDTAHGPSYVFDQNARFLASFITEGGIIIKRSKTRISAKAQRKVARAIKTARAFGLMPFTAMGTKQFVFGKTMENRDEDYEF